MLRNDLTVSEEKERIELRQLLEESLRAQGFAINGNRVAPPDEMDKADVRRLHALAVDHRRGCARKNLERWEPKLLNRIAAGAEVDPKQIYPRLVEVQRRSEEELLFRYACLHWSIPVSSGYGRRLRFIVIDEQNDKLIGVIGLGDPVFSLSARDDWVGWKKKDRLERLHHVVDAFVLGAVPPYSQLLCGKLIALLTASNEVRKAFERKYGQRQSLIRNRDLDGRLALITTTSALGRSSVYRRLRMEDQHIYTSCGFTRGSGEFHFANGVYFHISEFAHNHFEPSAKQQRWGNGFRNRREVIRRVLKGVGLSPDWLYHGIGREVFVVPLAENAREFLRGDEETLRPLDMPADRIIVWFRERWLIPRAGREKRWLDFLPENYRLWGKKGT